MALKENSSYWNLSLKNPEPTIDDYYVYDDVIINDKNLIKKIERLRELIIAYCVVSEGKSEGAEKILDEMLEIINSVDNIQYTEFMAFWKVFDMSHSVFTKLVNKKAALKELLKRYCQKRRKLYDNLGYTNVIVQALYDSGASRKKGVSGIEKLKSMIEKIFGDIAHAKSLKDFEKLKIAYFLPDKGNKILFKDFRKKYKVSYKFGRQHQSKEPDMVLKCANQILIIEAKHIKESGGAQDKQIVETIEFIKFSEPLSKIHYVSFLDGIYFNSFMGLLQNDNKTTRQKKDIETFLKSNKKNFFVNTAGIKAMLDDMKNI